MAEVTQNKLSCLISNVVPLEIKSYGGGKSFIRPNSKWKALTEMAWLMITIITLIIINSNNNDKSNK